jgi:hypothetical protein
MVVGAPRGADSARKEETQPAAAEIVRLSEALDAYPKRVSTSASKLLLLTGARHGERCET